MSGAFNNYGQEYNCPICGVQFDSEYGDMFHRHVEDHDKEAERVVEEINAIDAAMNRAKEGK